MAKIRKFDFKRHESGINIETHLEYNKPEGYSDRPVFFIRIPDNYKDLVKDKRVNEITVWSWSNRGQYYNAACGKTEEEAMNNFKAYMELYLSSASTQEDVILYQFKYKSKNINSKKEKDDRDFYWARDNTNSKIELDFDFCVCIKKTFGSKSTYYKKEKTGKKANFGRDADEVTNEVHQKTGGHDSWVEVPYTTEGEAFFTELYAAMEGLCKKFTAFMGTQQDILKTLESKQKFLS